MPNPLEDTRTEFIESVGLKSQSDGLPRTAGRLLGMLIWDGEEVAFGDLADKLQVSRGSISTATRILEERRLIKRTTKPGQRQDFFQLAENPYEKMLEVIALKLEHTKAEIAKTLSDIPEGESAIKARVEAYANFYEQMSGALCTVLNKAK